MIINSARQKVWMIGHNRTIDLAAGPVLMGILNVTPDSFSDGGQCQSVPDAKDQAMKMAEQGAHIIDVGGESTRPGARETDSDTELARVLPVIKSLCTMLANPVSVDTYRAETARQAVLAGASIINDVHGLQREPDIARVAAEHRSGVVIMHTGRGRDRVSDPIEDQKLFFDKSLEIASRAGVREQQIVLDPGFGFGKGADEGYELVSRFSELQAFGFPLLVGVSRKRFLDLTGECPARERDVETASLNVMLFERGALLFRVHNVGLNQKALAIAAKASAYHMNSEICVGTG